MAVAREDRAARWVDMAVARWVDMAEEWEDRRHRHHGDIEDGEDVWGQDA